MKKSILLLYIILYSFSIHSQNDYSFLIQANHIRIYSQPSIKSAIPNSYLRFGETIRLVNIQIIERDYASHSTNKFFRIYRNSNNRTIYYINIDEFSIYYTNRVLKPSQFAIQEETFLKHVFTVDKTSKRKVGDIFFFNSRRYNINGVYTFINKASFKVSTKVDTSFEGFYSIESISKYKVFNNTKYIFCCEPLNTTFNRNYDKKIYIDIDDGIEFISFHSFDFENDFFHLMLEYANQDTPEIAPETFYTDYLVTLFGQSSLEKMNEFQKFRLLSNGKHFMDSIYKNRNFVYNSIISCIYYSQLSDYNFQENHFKILSFSDGNNELHKLKVTFNFNGETYWPDGNLYFYKLVNLPLINKELKMSEDSAELFIKEIEKNPLDVVISHNASSRKVILKIYYKYLSPQNAEFFCKKHKIEIFNLNNSKLIDYIEVYTSDLIKKWAIIYPTK